MGFFPGRGQKQGARWAMGWMCLVALSSCDTARETGELSSVAGEQRSPLSGMKGLAAESMGFGLQSPDASGDEVASGSRSVDFGETRASVDVSALTTFDVRLKGYSAQATWSAYLNRSKNSITDAERIVADQSVEVSSFNFDPIGRSPATAALFVVVKEGEDREVYYAPYDLDIFGQERRNRSPFVKINRPRDGEFYLNGSEMNIRFESVDLDGDQLSYTLEYKCSNQDDWSVGVANLEPEQQQDDELVYTWLVANEVPRSSRCRLRIAANDGLVRGFGEMAGLLGVAPEPVRFADVQATLNAQCVMCHGPNRAERDFRADILESIPADQATDQPEQRGLRERIGRVIDRINRPSSDNQLMPQGGPPLPQADIELLELFEMSGLDDDNG